MARAGAPGDFVRGTKREAAEEPGRLASHDSARQVDANEFERYGAQAPPASGPVE